MPQTTTNEWIRYAGLAGQFLVAIGLSVFAGLKADHWLRVGIPLFSWLLPLLMIVLMIYKIYKDTSPKKDEKEK